LDEFELELLDEFELELPAATATGRSLPLAAWGAPAAGAAPTATISPLAPKLAAYVRQRFPSDEDTAYLRLAVDDARHALRRR
jgi:hypothetical protein